eukprot:2241379-Prymnesium_polylepis.1
MDPADKTPLFFKAHPDRLPPAKVPVAASAVPAAVLAATVFSHKSAKTPTQRACGGSGQTVAKATAHGAWGLSRTRSMKRRLASIAGSISRTLQSQS